MGILKGQKTGQSSLIKGRDSSLLSFSEIVFQNNCKKITILLTKNYNRYIMKWVIKMIKSFSVRNYKSFKDEIVFDFGDIKDYKFNSHVIQNNLLNSAIIYGKNASGKSNLGLALFDITIHLIDKEQIPMQYSDYLNGNSDDFCIFDIPYETVIEAILEAQDSGQIHTSITEQVNLPSKELLEDFIKKGYPNKRYSKFKIGPLKLLADGSLGGRTAALHKPYSDDLNNLGVLNFNDEELVELIQMADDAGMDSAIHVIGDKATDQVLKALKAVISSSKRETHRHSLIHAQMVNMNQIETMKKYHIGAIVQPIFLNSDLSMIKDRLQDRIQETYLFHSMYQSGITVGFSTDCPVENLNPFENLFVSMSRTSLKTPKLKPHLLNESFRLEEALSCYISSNLEYIYEQEQIDYIMVDSLPNELEIAKIPSIQVLQTVIDGKVVYQKLNL